MDGASSRISDEEMKRLMIEVVNRVFTFLSYPEELAVLSAQTRGWDIPHLDQKANAGGEATHSPRRQSSGRRLHFENMRWSAGYLSPRMLACFCGRASGRKMVSTKITGVIDDKPVVGGRVVYRRVSDSGEINSSRSESWHRTIDVFDEKAGHSRGMPLFSDGRRAGVAPDAPVVHDQRSSDGASLRRLLCGLDL